MHPHAPPSICRTLVVALVVALTTANAAAETDSADPLSTVRAYDEAWNRKDAAGLKTLTAPDFVYFSSRGALWSRDRFLGMLLSPKYVLESANRSELSVYRTGDTAVVNSRWQGRGSFDGKPFVDDQRCSLVLARLESKWIVASEHCTPIRSD